MEMAMGQVHKLVDEHGRQLAARHIITRRPDRVAMAAASSMADEHMGESSTIIYSGWCHAGLPHRKTPDEQDWRIQTEHLTLVVEPGKLPNKDGSTSYVGVPYGPIARLILYYLMDRALETGCRTVTLGKTLTAFLTRLGLSNGGKTHRIIREQVERISRCRLTFHLEGNGRRGVANQAIIDSAMFFDGPNTNNDNQASLFTDTLHLSEGFYNHLRQHNVFLDEKAIEKIHANSRALDVYSWLAFRLHHLGDPTFIPWATLRPQFGVGITVKRNFPSVMRDDLMLALSVYEKAKVDILDQGVLLHPSPPPVQRRPLIR
jgi:hypothetical protein